MCAPHPGSGRPDAVGYTTRCLSRRPRRRDVVILSQREPAVAQTAFLPSVPHHSPDGQELGFNFLKTFRCPRTSSGSIGSDMTRDNDLRFEVATASADHRLPCLSAPSLYATASRTPLPSLSCTRSQSVHPYLTIRPEGEQRTVYAQFPISTVVFLPSLAFLRFEPAIISLNIDGHNQWLS